MPRHTTVILVYNFDHCLVNKLCSIFFPISILEGCTTFPIYVIQLRRFLVDIVTIGTCLEPSGEGIFRNRNLFNEG